MPYSIRVQANDDADGAKCRALAESVIAEFGDKLSGANVLCFLDDQEFDGLRRHVGVANRGMFTPIERTFDTWDSPWPQYVRDIIFVDDPASLNVRKQQLFDELVYLHGSTCETEVGLIMTLAHELQHVVQHTTDWRLWATNTAPVRTFPRRIFQSAGLKMCDIPIELEARIVSKASPQNSANPKM